MKKIAIFVEGQTEQFFINKLLIEIAGRKNILIELKKFSGKRISPKSDIYPKTIATPIAPKHSVLIYDCGGDDSVKSRIIEEYQDLQNDGYLEIIGIRDLYPLTDLSKLENRLANGIIVGGIRREPSLPLNSKIIVAVREIEDWFIAECKHYSCIDKLLVFDNSQITTLGFNPCTDDLTVRNNSAADDLNAIYQLVNETYSKNRKKVERTVECLDYANLYLNVSKNVQKLGVLINKIDNFLT